MIEWFIGRNFRCPSVSCDMASAQESRQFFQSREDARIGKSAARSRTQAKTIIRQVVEKMIRAEQIVSFR
jgi:hypothetical protein